VVRPGLEEEPDDPEARADRLWNAADAQAIADAVRGQGATVVDEAKPSTQASPCCTT
jgi:DNA topoisomerase-3